MANLIDKSALVAEIERRINEINLDTIEDWRYRLQREHDIEVMKNILSLINTLEVKEVDLEKEIDNYLLTYWNEEREKFLHPFLKKMCVHFFELGITASNKVQKGK